MADHYPLPNHLHNHITKIADLVGKETSASNAIYVIGQTLGAVYTAGHCDGMTQTRSTQWITDSLEKQLAKNKEGATP